MAAVWQDAGGRMQPMQPHVHQSSSKAALHAAVVGSFLTMQRHGGCRHGAAGVVCVVCGMRHAVRWLDSWHSHGTRPSWKQQQRLRRQRRPRSFKPPSDQWQAAGCVHTASGVPQRLFLWGSTVRVRRSCVAHQHPRPCANPSSCVCCLRLPCRARQLQDGAERKLSKKALAKLVRSGSKSA